MTKREKSASKGSFMKISFVAIIVLILLVSSVSAAKVSPPSSKKDFTITWNPTPSRITYGTPLGSGQLNAQASIDIKSTVYSPKAGTVLMAGQQTLTVTMVPVNSRYKTETKTVKIMVEKATPTISYSPVGIAAGTKLGAKQFNAKAIHPVTGKTILGVFVYSTIVNGKVILLNQNTKLAAGTYTIKVDFIPFDIKDYKIATSTGTLVVGGGSSIPVATHFGTVPSSLTTTYGVTPLIPVVTVFDANNNDVTSQGTIVWTSTNPTSVGTQQWTLTFNPTDTKKYSSCISSPITVTINPAQKIDPVINWNPNPTTMIYGAALTANQLNAQVSGVAGNFKYEDLSVAGVQVDVGTILGIGTHHIRVTFTPTGTDANKYNSATKTIDFTVNDNMIVTHFGNVPSSLTTIYGVVPPIPSVNVFDTNNNDVTSQGTIIWTSTNSQEVGTQQWTLTFNPTDLTKYRSCVSPTIAVTINPATKIDPVITWNPNPTTFDVVTPLTTDQLNAKVSGVTGNFVYEVIAPNVAPLQVHVGDLLTFGNKNIRITFTPTGADADKYNSVTKEILFTSTLVEPYFADSLPSSLTTTYGTIPPTMVHNVYEDKNGITYDVTALGNIEWTSSNIKEVGTQQWTISFIPFHPEECKSAISKPITVTINPATKIDPVITWNPISTDISYGTAITSDQLNAQVSGVTGDITYDDQSINGVHVPVHVGDKLTVGKHSIVAIFTPTGADADKYNSVAYLRNFDVLPITPTINWEPNPTTFTSDKPLTVDQLNAQVTGVTGNFVYEETLTEGYRVVHVGDLLTVGTHHIRITFTPTGTDADKYYVVSQTKDFTVTDVTPIATHFGAVPVGLSMPYGGTLPVPSVSVFDANNNEITSQGTIVWTSTNSQEVGIQQWTLTFNPTDSSKYSSCISDPITINIVQVEKIDPVINWNPNPITMTYGTALTTDQLNAQVSGVTGDFVYEEIIAEGYRAVHAGDILTVGTHHIRVTFTPTGADADKYNSVTQTIDFIVNDDIVPPGVVEVTQRDQIDAALQNGPVFLVAGAGWCEYCQQMKPVMQDLATEYNGKVTVMYINIDKSPNLVDYFGISSLPDSSIITDVSNGVYHYMSRDGSILTDRTIARIIGYNDKAYFESIINFALTYIPPKANDDVFNFKQTPYGGNVLTNDVGTGIYVDSASLCTNGGAINMQSNGDFTYTPSMESSGSDSFTYKIKNERGATSVARVTITYPSSSTALETHFVLPTGQEGKSMILGGEFPYWETIFEVLDPAGNDVFSQGSVSWDFSRPPTALGLQTIYFKYTPNDPSKYQECFAPIPVYVYSASAVDTHFDPLPADMTGLTMILGGAYPTIANDIVVKDSAGNDITSAGKIEWDNYQSKPADLGTTWIYLRFIPNDFSKYVGSFANVQVNVVQAPQ